MNFFWASNGTTKEEKNSSACRSPGWRLWLVHCAFHLPCLWVDVRCNQVLWCVLRRNTPLLCNDSNRKLMDHIHLCGNSAFWGYVPISISTSRGLPLLILLVTFAFECLTEIHWLICQCDTWPSLLILFAINIHVQFSHKSNLQTLWQ